MPHSNSSAIEMNAYKEEKSSGIQASDTPTTVGRIGGPIPPSQFLKSRDHSSYPGCRVDLHLNLVSRRFIIS